MSEWETKTVKKPIAHKKTNAKSTEKYQFKCECGVLVWKKTEKSATVIQYNNKNVCIQSQTQNKMLEYKKECFSLSLRPFKRAFFICYNVCNVSHTYRIFIGICNVQFFAFGFNCFFPISSFLFHYFYNCSLALSVWNVHMSFSVCVSSCLCQKHIFLSSFISNVQVFFSFFLFVLVHYPILTGFISFCSHENVSNEAKKLCIFFEEIEKNVRKSMKRKNENRTILCMKIHAYIFSWHRTIVWLTFYSIGCPFGYVLLCFLLLLLFWWLLLCCRTISLHYFTICTHTHTKVKKNVAKGELPL